MISSVIVRKCAATLMQWSSLAKVLVIIFMFLLIFFVSAEDRVVPSVSTMSKRGKWKVDNCLVGGLSYLEWNTLRPQDVWDWL